MLRPGIKKTRGQIFKLKFNLSSGIVTSPIFFSSVDSFNVQNLTIPIINVNRISLQSRYISEGMAQRPKPFLALISRLRYLLLKGPEVGDSWPKTENKQKTSVF